MARALAKTKSKKERGMALLLTLFALLLLSGIGLFMVLSSNTETRIDANYGSSLRAYYAARSGLEEVRDRIRYASNSPLVPAGLGLADKLPTDVAGNPNGVLYIVNPANGETIDPTDITSPYFDDDLCHAFNSGTPKGIKCTTIPTTAGWQLTSIPSQVLQGSRPLAYKWVRIMMKTNRTAAPYFVDQGSVARPMLAAGQTGAPLDTRVCWDGQAEQLLPSGENPTCDANGMQTVYMLTALAITSQGSGINGARKLLQSEVVAPSIRPAGVLTAASMNLPMTVNAGIPPVAIDGRVHKLDGTVLLNADGTPATPAGCSSVAPLATNTGSNQMEQMLDLVRKNIVDTANASCNADGSGKGGNSCPPALWWVRGTDLSTRFVTSVTTGTSGGSGSSPGGSGHDGDGDGDGDHHGHHDPVGISTTACDPASPSCYTNLDLSAPELFAASATAGVDLPQITSFLANKPAPFIGNSGNQADSTIYQPPATQTVGNEITAVKNLVTFSQNKANYFSVSAATLNAGNSSYGSSGSPGNPNNPPSPAVVVVTDPSLTLSNVTLSGYGVLVVPSSLEITSTATLNWNGIVLVKSSTGQVTVDAGAKGYINGALLLAPGAGFNINGSSSGNLFQITYSCDAIDLAFSTLPFKVVSTAETSF
ncbi:MAG TPA: hypothetical protein VFB76_07430 [Candidatus Angelobacter sp.]|nr:hypothetical protein [Candidatus Angelobacter sp.]